MAISPQRANTGIVAAMKETHRAVLTEPREHAILCPAYRG